MIQSNRKAAWADRLATWSPQSRLLVDVLVTTLSLALCALLMPSRLPGFDLLGVGPDWLLIWTVAWSLQRGVWQGALGGAIAGALQDGMSAPEPTHMLSLAIVGVLTALMSKHQYLREDFVAVALLVFAMVIVSETILAGQFIWTGGNPSKIWTYHQRIALSSAILSSLWSPLIYSPLKRWWSALRASER